MPVTARLSGGNGAGGGFSLLEVVVATALLLLTIVVVTATVANSSRAQSRLDRVMTLDCVLRGEAERLRALPYCAPSYPAMTQAEVATGRLAGDLVGDVFPHAVTSANREDARFVAASTTGDEPAGAFVTRTVIDGVAVTRVARFLASGGSAPMGSDVVAGWAVWSASPPPARLVEVRLGAQTGDLHRECRVLCAALAFGAPDNDDDADGGAW